MPKWRHFFSEKKRSTWNYLNFSYKNWFEIFEFFAQKLTQNNWIFPPKYLNFCTKIFEFLRQNWVKIFEFLRQNWVKIFEFLHQNSTKLFEFYLQNWTKIFEFLRQNWVFCLLCCASDLWTKAKQIKCQEMLIFSKMFHLN